MKKIIVLAASLTTMLYLTACTTSSTLMSKRELDIQAKTSASIFVEPVAKEKRTVYLEVRSGVQEFDRAKFLAFINQEFAKNPNGYRLIDNPEKAQFIMQAFVLNLEKTSETAAKAALNQGYIGGSVLAGAAIGAAVHHNDRYAGAGVGGLALGAADFVGSNLVKDVYYMLVADIKISEKTKDDKQAYQTRVVTTANKVNLKLEQASDGMFQKTAYAISSFF